MEARTSGILAGIAVLIGAYLVLMLGASTLDLFLYLSDGSDYPIGSGAAPWYYRTENVFVSVSVAQALLSAIGLAVPPVLSASNQWALAWIMRGVPTGIVLAVHLSAISF